MLGDQEFLNHPAEDEMLLDDPLEHRRIALTVPGAFRIHDRNRAAFADAQAVRLGAQDAALVRQPELLQSALQIVPGRKAPLPIAALRGRLVGAEEDMA